MLIDWLDNIFQHFPTLIQLSVFVGSIFFVKWWMLGSRLQLGAEAKLPRQVLFFFISIVIFVGLILVLNVPESIKGQILSLLGILLTAVIALSSTTFVANAMSGLLLRMINSFKPGDFIKVQGQFGRVTQRGLFHCEIQTEDRDLTTIPNLYLMTNNVSVIHKSGTIVSVSLSLGYEYHHQIIEPLLLKSAQDTQLTDPFVMVTELSDFSVSYKVAGFLEDVTKNLTVRSKLRKNILTVLHSNNIEIVSPNFVNQRVYDLAAQFIPKAQPTMNQVLKNESIAEDIMFDKGQLADEIEQLTYENSIDQAHMMLLLTSVENLEDETIKDQLLKKVESLKESKDAQS
ncbi:mechanosensitive ion channel family protein [Marinicellulosiphila megalodicopiae]|uniref:mechanosensitive ion channel family protein n=1 Tax=Marinicellulosiphila megalodicopiae TaxID=2724896 RepID=UPI003BAFCA81